MTGPPPATCLTPRALALRFGTHPAVYEPAEDTFLLAGMFIETPDPTGSALPLEGVRLLDLCCGCGLVGLWAALHGATVVAVDINPHAVTLTTANREVLGSAVHGRAVHGRLSVIEGDLFAALQANTEPFDLIVCNPPYLPADPEGRTARPCRPGEDPETARWQALALESGQDGAALVRRVLQEAGSWLREPKAGPGGSEADQTAEAGQAWEAGQRGAGAAHRSRAGPPAAPAGAATTAPAEGTAAAATAEGPRWPPLPPLRQPIFKTQISQITRINNEKKSVKSVKSVSIFAINRQPTPPPPTPPHGLYLLVSSRTGLTGDDWRGWRTETVARQAVGPYDELRVVRARPEGLSISTSR